MKSYQRGKIIGDNSNLKIPYGTKGKTIKRLTSKSPFLKWPSKGDTEHLKP